MNQQRKKFQVIGSCRRMQTLSLEDEFRRMEGISYDIDFYQDFSTVTLENIDNRMCISEIVEEIMNPKVIDVRQESDTLCLITRQQNEDFWSLVDKEEKKEAKREKRWKKHHKKISTKQAEKNFMRVYKELMGE